MTFWLLAALMVSNISSAKGDEQLTTAGAHTQRVAPLPQTVFELMWRVPLVRMGMARTVNESFGRPAISLRHELVVIATGEGDVMAFSLHDGEPVWRYRYGNPFETGAAIFSRSQWMPGEDAEVVIVGARDGVLQALDVKTGQLWWKTAIDGDMRAPPRLAEGRLVLATAANKVVAVDVESGELLWSQGRPLPTGLTVEGHARPWIEEDRVFATFSDGYVMAMTLERGSVIWQRPLSLRGGVFVDADADPVITQGQLFVASYSDGVYALNPDDGQTIWNRQAPAVTSMTLAEGRLVAGSADGYVWAFAPSDGALGYRTRLGAGGAVSRMAARDGMLVITSGDNGLAVLDARSGRPVQATTLGGRTGGDPTWVGDHLAFISSSGYLYAWARPSHED